MSDAAWELQRAVFTALDGNLSGLARQAPVYDGEAPEGSRYPYVVIDSQTMVPDGPLAGRRDLRHLYLSVWSTYSGQREVNRILGQIYALLHQQRLPMPDGYRMVRCRVTRQSSAKDADGVTYMGSCTIEARIEH